jgi:hypothetical protein
MSWIRWGEVTGSGKLSSDCKRSENNLTKVNTAINGIFIMFTSMSLVIIGGGWTT